MKTSDALLLGFGLVAAYALFSRDSGAPTGGGDAYLPSADHGTPTTPLPVAVVETTPMVTFSEAATFGSQVVEAKASISQKSSKSSGGSKAGGSKSSGGTLSFSSNPVVQAAVTKPGSLGAALSNVFSGPYITTTSKLTSTSPTIQRVTSQPASVAQALDTIFKKPKII